MFQSFQIALTFTVCMCLPRNSIPGPDHLSTLSTTIELLQLLLPEDSAEVIPDQEDEPMEEEPLKRTTEISISAVQMRTFLKFESEDGPLKTLEKRLEVCDSLLIISVNRSIDQLVSERYGV